MTTSTIKVMMGLHDKVEIEAYLREDVDLHLYSIGDLDDFFWPHTSWFAAKSGSDLRAVALLYTGLSLPTLLALSRETQAMQALLESIEHIGCNVRADNGPALSCYKGLGFQVVASYGEFTVQRQGR